MPIIIWYGGADTLIDPSTVTGFASAVNGAGGNVTLVYRRPGTIPRLSRTSTRQGTWAASSRSLFESV